MVLSNEQEEGSEKMNQMNTLSLWSSTANSYKKGKTLEGNEEADVVVIGAGFTGLSSAYHLQKLGKNVIVLEQETIGYGASGRNGGMVLPGYKPTMQQLAKKYGPEEARQLNDLSLFSIELVKNMIDEHQINCDFRNTGHIVAAYKAKHFEELKLESAYLNENFGYESRMLDRSQLHQEIDSPFYHGCLVDDLSYSFHPLNYAIGLGEAAKSIGARIFEHSKVLSIEYGRNSVKVKTKKGSAIAKDIIVATDGYSGKIINELNKGVLPISARIIATEPLPESLLNTVIPKNRMVFDTSSFLYYFRRTPDNRIVFGGGDIRPNLDDGVYQKVYDAMVNLMPKLAGSKIEYRWGGFIGVTIDTFPVIGRSKEGAYFATGYTGHGASLSTLFGKLLAQWIVTGNAGGYRFEKERLKSFPFHNQKNMLVNLAHIGFKLHDIFA
ncbi:MULTISPECIES: NAD(P)/FAD-dependent oxidoreductase [Bacillus cereus group]|uniref:NAD(P)/FAD-dependent oxidoreductase n=1 Tax=Bacillus cereus group TaxID=86661 RepID=UPI00030A20C1|nr:MULTISPECIES: FAD-binding oxidoreductase [Bacillus cereus group]PFA22805.1 FAD-binding oxidoreductase [Bacillus cereus]PFR24691.1 FAD-binding oxidoreductase [Bacillus cereus]PGZ15597.1 FAD-binding oxidoreductase [Bacillus cereus]